MHYSSASWSIHSKTSYDGLERAVKATNPYRGTTAATDGWTRTTYDVAGRVTEVATFSGGFRVLRRTAERMRTGWVLTSV
ncbi:MAG: hypothetical protein AB1631_20150 [Acidobacteriota bacterium]